MNCCDEIRLQNSGLSNLRDRNKTYSQSIEYEEHVINRFVEFPLSRQTMVLPGLLYRIAQMTDQDDWCLICDLSFGLATKAYCAASEHQGLANENKVTLKSEPQHTHRQIV